MENYKVDAEVLNEKPDVYDAEGKTDGGTLVRGTSGEQAVEDKTSGKDKKNKATIAGKAKAGKVETIKNTSEHLEAIFNGEDLSEDFMSKTATIFESAINERVNAINESLQAEYETQLQESTQQILKDLSEKLDDYLNYVVEEWMKANEVAMEHKLKAEIAEGFMSGLKGLFEQHNISVPEEQFDMLDAASEKVAELEDKLNEALESNVELSKVNADLKRTDILLDVASDLADTEVEKFAGLTENIEYTSEEDFREKVETIKEGYFPKATATTPSDDTAAPVEGTEEVEVTDVMGAYMSAISRTHIRGKAEA